jgi:PTS system nitrogen regulatory IIA component
MQIQNILTPSRTLCGIEAASKKRALEILANTIAADVDGIDADDLFRRLIARERLGSTGIGQGIAIPHCRVENCQQTLGALITLADPIDFDSMDSEPVDTLFAMLAPEDAQEEHLQYLAILAGALSNEKFRENLRNAKTDAELFSAMTAINE